MGKGRACRSARLREAAGAVGTGGLDAATYADMTIRGRSSSSVSSQVVELEAGTVYELVRPLPGDVSAGPAGLALAPAAMAGSDVPAAAITFEVFAGQGRCGSGHRSSIERLGVG